MLYTIQNERLTATVSDFGAELISVKDASGEEWIWEGDPAYWDQHSPILFPYCGRFWQGLVTVNDEPCNPGMQFFRFLTTNGEQIDEKTVSFTLSSSAETLEKYPFPFEMKMTYTLEGDVLSVSAEVKNTGTRVMHYGYGVHPGFRFSEASGKYLLRFPEGHSTRAMCLDASECYPVGGPLVYVEPWTSLPSYYGKETELTEKRDLVHLPAEETRVHPFRMQFGA